MIHFAGFLKVIGCELRAKRSFRWSHQNPLHHTRRLDAGEALVEALVFGELRVVDAEAMKERRVEVVGTGERDWRGSEGLERTGEG